MRSASRSIDIEVPAHKVMAAICDFEHYPDFVSSVLDAELETRTEGHWRVQFEVLLLRRKVKYRLDLQQDSDHGLSWRMVDGDWMVENEGEWELIPLSEHRTRAIYRVRVTLDDSIPQSFVTLLLDASLPRMLREFKRRAELHV